MGHAHLCQRLFQLDVGRDGEVEQTGKIARAAVKAGKVLKGPLFKLPTGWSHCAITRAGPISLP